MRRDDEWGTIVLNRIEGESDFVAAVGQCYNSCDSSFCVVKMSTSIAVQMYVVYRLGVRLVI